MCSLHYMLCSLIVIFVGLFLSSNNLVRADGDKCTSQISEPPREQALVLVKPDGVARALVGEIISRFERKGFKLVAIKMMNADKQILDSHYEEHAGKNFFPSLVEYMMSGPVVPMVWQGNNVVKIARSMLGATDPLNSQPGTIRGDLGLSKQKNLLHVSDSVQSAKREIDLWFSQQQILDWNDVMHAWK